MSGSSGPEPAEPPGSTVGTKQHRVPAAIVGRFGRAKTGKPWRQARVRITDLSTGRSFCRSAESFAAEHGAFDYEDGVRSVDHLWDEVESALGPAVEWVTRKVRPTAETLEVDDALRHLGVLQRYAAQTTLRSPDFDRVGRSLGMSVDDIQDRRASLEQQGRSSYALGTLDLEVLTRRDPSAGSLLLNDLGYVQLADAEKGLLVPLAPDLAVFVRHGPPVLEDPSLGIGWLDPYMAEARRAMALARPAEGGHGPRWLYSHPDEDVPELA